MISCISLLPHIYSVVFLLCLFSSMARFSLREVARLSSIYASQVSTETTKLQQCKLTDIFSIKHQRNKELGVSVTKSQR